MIVASVEFPFSTMPSVSQQGEAPEDKKFLSQYLLITFVEDIATVIDIRMNSCF
jgi:hypothetical protein